MKPLFVREFSLQEITEILSEKIINEGQSNVKAFEMSFISKNKNILNNIKVNNIDKIRIECFQD